MSLSSWHVDESLNKIILELIWWGNLNHAVAEFQSLYISRQKKRFPRKFLSARPSRSLDTCDRALDRAWLLRSFASSCPQQYPNIHQYAMPQHIPESFLTSCFVEIFFNQQGKDRLATRIRVVKTMFSTQRKPLPAWLCCRSPVLMSSSGWSKEATILSDSRSHFPSYQVFWKPHISQPLHGFWDILS